MWKDKKGYLIARINGKTVRVHRYLWMQANGEIPDGFDVHHKNEVKDDNRLENLELLAHGIHSSLTNKGRNRTDDHRRKISIANKGRHPSEETKSLLSKRKRQEGKRVTNTSGFKGVRWQNPKWRASIMVDGKNIYLGTYESAIEAAEAYDKAAMKYFGEDCYLNLKKGA